MYDTTSNLKMSPTLSQEGLADKSSIASEFVLSSMADSGNFDDLPSSASVYSKDSIGFMTPLEFKQIQQEQSPALNDTSNEDEKIKIIRMYEKKLDDKKLEYEIELSNVIKTQEEKNLKIICEFESKLKEEELKFEARWNELLKATEEEKMLIVNRFEEKLEEEKKKYRESLIDYKAHDGKVKDVAFEMTYCKKVEEEKMIYETSLMDIKEKFRTEQLLIQKKFDDAMIAERKKFEGNLKSIKQLSDSQVSDLTKKLSELETQ